MNNDLEEWQGREEISKPESQFMCATRRSLMCRQPYGSHIYIHAVPGRLTQALRTLGIFDEKLPCLPTFSRRPDGRGHLVFRAAGTLGRLRAWRSFHPCTSLSSPLIKFETKRRAGTVVQRSRLWRRLRCLSSLAQEGRPLKLELKLGLRVIASTVSRCLARRLSISRVSYTYTRLTLPSIHIPFVSFTPSSDTTQHPQRTL